jgi:hypothetical protein
MHPFPADDLAARRAGTSVCRCYSCLGEQARRGVGAETRLESCRAGRPREVGEPRLAPSRDSGRLGVLSPPREGTGAGMVRLPAPRPALEEREAGGPPDRPPVTTNPVHAPPESSKSPDSAVVVRGAMLSTPITNQGSVGVEVGPHSSWPARSRRWFRLSTTGYIDAQRPLRTEEGAVLRVTERRPRPGRRRPLGAKTGGASCSTRGRRFLDLAAL